MQVPNKKPELKRIVTKIPLDIHNYFKQVAQKSKTKVETLYGVLLVSCAKGMISKDIEELEKLKSQKPEIEEKEEKSEETPS